MYLGDKIFRFSVELVDRLELTTLRGCNGLVLLYRMCSYSKILGFKLT